MQPIKAEQWRSTKLRFRVDTGPLDVACGAVLHGPSGQELRVPGFYEGDHTFGIRLHLPEPGNWRLTIESDHPGLAGQTCEIIVGPASAGVHGPLRAASQNWEYADGTPYLPLGFECDWLFALGLDEAETLLDQLGSHGFNQVVMNVYAHDVNWYKDPSVRAEHSFGSPDAWPFLGSNDVPNFGGLNLAFFAHLEKIIEAMERRGIVAHLMIYVWNKRVNWPPLRSAADDHYFDHVVKRFQGFSNLVWDISKEALDYGRADANYVVERIRRLRALDAFGSLVTVHDYRFCRTHPEEVDVISVQTWRSDLYSSMRRIVAEHPGKPVLNIEHGGYERSPYVTFPGDYTDPEVCLQRTIECYFAGSSNVAYWQGAAWDVVIFDPMALPPHERPCFGYYRNLIAWFERWGLQGWSVADDICSSGHALVRTMGDAMFMIPRGNHAIHVFAKSLSGRRARVVRHDPVTGHTEDSEQDFGHWHELRPLREGGVCLVHVSPV